MFFKLFICFSGVVFESSLIHIKFLLELGVFLVILFSGWSNDSGENIEWWNLRFHSLRDKQCLIQVMLLGSSKCIGDNDLEVFQVIIWPTWPPSTTVDIILSMDIWCYKTKKLHIGDWNEWYFWIILCIFICDTWIPIKSLISPLILL